MDIFKLAIAQIKREGKLSRKDWLSLVIDKAIYIRKWLDVSEKNLRSAKTRKLNKEKQGGV